MASLTDLIRSTASEITDPDPRAVALAVAERTDDDTIREHYAESLIGTVRVILGKDRQRALSNPPETLPQSSPSKVEQRRSWWQSVLWSRVSTGESWKFLGDCTADDLKFAMKERFDMADSIRATGDRYAALAELVTSHAVDTVAELPDEAVSAAMA